MRGQASPGKHSSLIVDKDVRMLDESEKKYFHSTMAKLLYLAKRARPDILTIISVVYEGTVCECMQDKEKLERVLSRVPQVDRISSTSTEGMHSKGDYGNCRGSICNT